MSEPGKQIRVLIVDDHEVVRMGLRVLLEKREELTIVGEAGSAAEAVEKALAMTPDIVLMDVRLPDESGVEACRRIRAEQPQIRVLMLTSYADDEAIFSSIVAGASGHLLKMIEAELLYQAVIAVANGKSLLDSTASEAVMERIREISEGILPNTGMDALAPREREILKLIADGLTNKEIAEQVCLSEKTVRNYVSAILQKLNVSHRTQAAVFYLRQNPSDLD